MVLRRRDLHLQRHGRAYRRLREKYVRRRLHRGAGALIHATAAADARLLEKPRKSRRQRAVRGI